MPHGESWFSYIPGYEYLLHLARGLSAPVSSDGLTWYAHEPISIQHVLGLLFVVFLLFVFGLVTFFQVKKTHEAIAPEERFSVRTFIELFTGYVYDAMAQMMGRKAAKFFLPLIGTCAFVIFFSNALGLFPFFPVPTSSLNTTLAMALVIFFATHIFGVKEHGLPYFKHFLGPYLPLAPLMLPIELISHIARPITLAVRLMANMTADHLVVGIFLGLAPIWFPMLPLPIYFLGV
ncbi:MAG: F0F1 ATP synthase subunit A, partial [Polyangiaceae bacterium]|nr:F0F1 ATP synthase subunit A [Polyangiaceae bacterium]